MIILLLSLNFSHNCFAATEFVSQINGGVAEDFNTLTLWEAAMDDAGDITAADVKVFTVNVETVAFADGEAVTGGTSGATGTCIHQSATQILIDGIASGPFVAEQITGGVAGDITILNDGDSSIIVAECYDDDGDLNDKATVISGFTTSATNYVKITSPVGERHDGTAGSGFTLKSTVASSTGYIAIKENYTIVEWITFNGNKGSVSLDAAVRFADISTNAIADFAEVRNNLIYDTDNFGIWEDKDQDDTVISNNIIYGVVGSGIFWGTLADGATKCYNNTVYGCGKGIDNDDVSFHQTVINNLSYNNTTTDFEGLMAAATASDYNFSKDDTAPEAAGNSIHGDTDGLTPDFVNVGAGVEDFHLQLTSDAIDQGFDLGTGTWSFDIDNRDRDAEGDVWDIGADEFVSGAPAVNNSQVIITNIW